MRIDTERGIALITTMLVMLLISALLIGFTAVIMSDQRYRFIDRDRGQAFYAASGAMEKMTADLGNLFFSNVAPTGAQVTALTASTAHPSVAGVTYTAGVAPTPLPASSLSTYYCAAPKTIRTVGTNGYTITYCAAANGNPTTTMSTPVKSGPYAGLIAAQTPYQLDVTARTSTGGEVHLVRTIEAVAIPVFQFGMFSDVDLAFFAGPNFNFGGRVHTNGSLFLSEGGGATLTLTDKVTAVKEIVRQQLQNGVSIGTAPSHDGTVSMAKAPGSFRNLAATEGSVVDGSASAQNEPTWHTISLSTYNSYIRNGRTGATPLNLPLITVGGTNPDLIRRAPVGESSSNAVLFNERLFSKASLRILLSDAAADITGLPTVTATAPVQLDGDWFTTPPNNGTAYGPVNVTHPPIARSVGALSTTVVANGANTAASFRVASVVPFMPAMLLNGVAVTCTAKDAGNDRFTGCDTTVPGAQGVGVSLTSAPGISVVTTTVTPSNANATIQVGAGNTAAFTPLPFWIGSTLVTCTGWDASPAFTGCTGLGAAPAGGATMTSYALSSAGTGTIGGYIKVDMQDAGGAWQDVTMQILNYGIGGPNLAGTICADPTPNAILRIQRLRDNGAACNYNTDTTGAKSANNWWPNVLFDPREALQRDTSPGATNLALGGVMHYIAIDVNNLTRWFVGTAPFNGGSGVNAIKDNGGFTVYFSDRRNNRNASSQETGEYGWEDFVNPSSPTGAPSSALEQGEDVNANSQVDTYGGIPNYGGVYSSVPPGAAAPLDAAARPTTYVNRGQAQVNRPILFRHALKLINGNTIAANGVTGLTIATENPVYLQGDWNANGAFNDPHAATSVIADAVTILSGGWSDNISFTQPYSPGNRNRNAASWYRLAIIAGKGAAFPQPAGTATDFGTDGGAHNFLRYLENGNQAVNFRGAIATFFYNREAVGTYKCCATVYGAPTRNYNFDTDFLTPALLPPNTPVFRDMNAVGFSQELRPGK